MTEFRTWLITVTDSLVLTDFYDNSLTEKLSINHESIASTCVDMEQALMILQDDFLNNPTAKLPLGILGKYAQYFVFLDSLDESQTNTLQVNINTVLSLRGISN